MQAHHISADTIDGEGWWQHLTIYSLHPRVYLPLKFCDTGRSRPVMHATRISSRAQSRLVAAGQQVQPARGRGNGARPLPTKVPAAQLGVWCCGAK